MWLICLLSVVGFLPTGPGEVKAFEWYFLPVVSGTVIRIRMVRRMWFRVIGIFAEAADRLIDLFVDNQLRLAKGYLDDVMKIRSWQG